MNEIDSKYLNLPYETVLIQTYRLAYFLVFVSKALRFAFWSEWLVVAGVVSQHVVELHVVDLVGCFGREAFRNDCILLFRDTHFEVVEDRPEAGEVYEPSSCLVLVLEVRLHQQSSVFHVLAKSAQTPHQHLLFSVI